MSNPDENSGKKGFGLMHAGMAFCCGIMMVPIIGFFVAGGTLASLGSNLGVLAPIALCLVAHVAMFAVMGKSCHGDKKSEKTAEEDIPLQPSLSRWCPAANEDLCRKFSAGRWRLPRCVQGMSRYESLT